MRTHIIAGTRRRGAINEAGGPEETPPWLLPDEDDVVETGVVANDGKPTQQAIERKPVYDISKGIRYLKVAADVQKSTGARMGGVNWGNVAGWAAQGAQVGGAVGGYGAIIGAVGGMCVGLFTEIRASNQVASEEAEGREWVERYCPNEYKDYMNDTLGIPSSEIYIMPVGVLTKGLMLFWLNKYNLVVSDDNRMNPLYPSEPNGAYYEMAGSVAGGLEVYTPMGVDYLTTRLEAMPSGTVSSYGTSQGRGGVFMKTAKIYRYNPILAPHTGTGSGTAPGPSGGNTSNASTGLLMGAAALGAFALLGKRR